MFAKSIASIAVILVSATALTAEANAGGCHRGGAHFYSAMHSQNYFIKRQQSLAAAKQRQQAIAAAKLRQQKAALAAAAAKKAEAVKVAKAETVKQEQAPVTKVAEAPAPAPAAEVALNATQTKVAAAEPATCKKFIPAIGATVDVACDQKN